TNRHPLDAGGGRELVHLLDEGPELGRLRNGSPQTVAVGLDLRRMPFEVLQLLVLDLELTTVRLGGAHFFARLARVAAHRREEEEPPHCDDEDRDGAADGHSAIVHSTFPWYVCARLLCAWSVSAASELKLTIVALLVASADAVALETQTSLNIGNR